MHARRTGSSLVPLLLLLFANFAGATSVIFIKASLTHPVLLACYRLLISVIFLLPVFFRDAHRHGVRVDARLFLPTLVPGIILGMHFISWIIGARLTLAANSTLIVNMVPVVMPFIMYALVGELITRWEAGGTVVSLAGVVLLTGRDFHLGSATFTGDLLCVLSMILLALYMALAKRNNRLPSIWLYVVPLYLVGAVFCFAVSLFFTSPAAQPVNAAELLSILGLALVPTVLGHSIFNHAMRTQRSQIVSLSSLTQFVFAAVLAWFFFTEIPEPVFYPATALILAGTVISLIRDRGRDRGTVRE